MPSRGALHGMVTFLAPCLEMNLKGSHARSFHDRCLMEMLPMFHMLPAEALSLHQLTLMCQEAAYQL